MLHIKELSTISKESKFYSSFPDLLQSRFNLNKFFLVYREADQHHPTVSYLIFMVSEDQGQSWRAINDFKMTLYSHKGVWNCPRLFYLEDDSLNIICDIKTSTQERTASFSTVILKSIDEGENFTVQKTFIPGMVPDKVIKFKDRLFCANHKIKSEKNDLIQLISWSRDNGETWFDTNILAHDYEKQFCEASLVNMGSYMVAYLRDNGGHRRNIYYTTSEDGLFWKDPQPMPIFGQRVTALYKTHTSVIGSYRNTKECKMSIFVHNLKDDQVNNFNIDWEHKNNQYNFGYSGLSFIEDGKYLLAYYIQQDEDMPFIKISLVEGI